MPEYTYLLEHRLTSAQKSVITHMRDAARRAGMTIFLAGGAVRDLTTGARVRDLDFAVQGNALDLERTLESSGATVWGKHAPTRTLYLWFPGSVRVEVSSTRREEYPKPGKPVYHWDTMVEDLKRRDFTANAMAVSLNDGSYGLLLDPLNGVADIEARLLRLTSPYGFIEDPSRLVRAVRLKHRLAWNLEERTQARYNNAKEDGAISAILPYLKGYELEKIACEEEGLQTLKALEAEGWMQHLYPAWTSATADLVALENLKKNWIQLLMQGVTPDISAAQLELLTAKMQTKELNGLKQLMARPGLRAQWEGLDEAAKEFARQLTGKEAATPSATWKLFMSAPAEAVLWLAHSKKAPAVEAKFKNFFTVWPEFKKQVPAALMLEMRITPELPGYAELLESLFFHLIDGKLGTDEEMRAFLEPWSPPAPAPPPVIRRTRAKKTDSKAKRRVEAPDDEEDDEDDEEDNEDDDEKVAIKDPLDEEDEAIVVIDDEEDPEVEGDDADPDEGDGDSKPAKKRKAIDEDSDWIAKLAKTLTVPAVAEAEDDGDEELVVAEDRAGLPKPGPASKPSSPIAEPFQAPATESTLAPAAKTEPKPSAKKAVAAKGTAPIKAAAPAKVAAPAKAAPAVVQAPPPPAAKKAAEKATKSVARPAVNPTAAKSVVKPAAKSVAKSTAKPAKKKPAKKR